MQGYNPTEGGLVHEASGPTGGDVGVSGAMAEIDVNVNDMTRFMRALTVTPIHTCFFC